MMNMHSICKQNFDEFLGSVRKMLPWLNIYDNNKYSRLLPDHQATLVSLN